MSPADSDGPALTEERTILSVFSLDEARHYCHGFSTTSGSAATSLKDYHASFSSGITQLREGTPAFDEYRNCALRDVDRLLFLSASQYRRSLDLMLESSSGWAFVTLYYCSFFSASALLGMLGASIDAPSLVVEVERGNPGNQELVIHRGRRALKKLQLMSTSQGSHRTFWDVFYQAWRSQDTSWVDSLLHIALNPVSGDSGWQIRNRNAINYDSWKAFDLAREFQHTFKRSQFPKSLRGVLNTQYQVSEAMTLLAFSLAKEIGLQTDALDLLTPVSTRNEKLKRMVFGIRPPNLERKIKGSMSRILA